MRKTTNVAKKHPCVPPRTQAPAELYPHSASAKQPIYPMRLQRFLARAGVASRRGSENLMTAGRVKVNGIVVTELGSKVDPNLDAVTVDGYEVHLNDTSVCLMLYKPCGYITTMSDPYGRPCVADLVPLRQHPGLFPVGRLDQDTTGLLLFTTDGNLGQSLLHPSHHVDKHYVALVRGVPEDRELQALRRGIMLDDNRMAPARVELLSAQDPMVWPVAPTGVPFGDSVVGITVHEGKKHQVKRMLAAIGHQVVRLHRDSFGPLTLAGVTQGCWRYLDENEYRLLQKEISAP